MSGDYIRGAFVQFMDTFLIPLPNVIIFQFNPETITHSWTPAAARTDALPGANPLAVKGPPTEAFTFSLAMDAGDMIADGSPIAVGIATATGIYTRLAALEMLQFPVAAKSGAAGELIGSVTAGAGGGAVGGAIGGAIGAAVGGAAGAAARPIPELVLPTVLFVWGPGRILPVKVTNLQITEKLYDRFLSPTHADATVNLSVLTPEELAGVTGPLKAVAKGAYRYSELLRQTLALANLANSVESIIGMLPL